MHGSWVPGPGSCGRNDAGDAGIDAAMLSDAVGRLVRVQGMRYEGHGWDPKGPAPIHHARAALDHDGDVVGYVFESKGFSRIDIDTNKSTRATASRPAAGPPAEVVGGFRHARRILWLRQQASGLGDGRTLARPHLAIAHRASARARGPADFCERSEAISHLSWLDGRDCFRRLTMNCLPAPAARRTCARASSSGRWSEPAFLCTISEAATATFGIRKTGAAGLRCRYSPICRPNRCREA